MVSVRTKIVATFVFGLLMIASVIVAVLSAARSAAMYDDEGRRALTNAELVMRILEQSHPPSTSLFVTDSLGRRVLDDRVRALLRVVPEYVVVIDRKGDLQFTSEDVNRLDNDDWRMLQRGFATLPNGQTAGVISLARERVMMLSRHVEDRGTELDRVVTGVRVTHVTEWPAQLTTTVVVAIPLFLVMSGWAVWVLLGSMLTRLERIRREVADITDGRSLHRRLSTDDAEPELAALVATLNAMITRLEASFVALRRFTADASHELKTPITVLRADVERAMHDATSRTEQMIALEEALHETTRMADLVESLLTLARADEGRFDLYREPVDLYELAQEVYETAVILGEAADVTVALPFTANVTVLGDRTRLRQLFLNLITNAIKYTPAGGRVDIGLGRHIDTVTFAVRDTGIGIAAAEMPHVFERFWRADHARSRTAERSGFGLGLAISHWIAQAHGGTLTVDSRLGKGSLFTVTLPLTQEVRTSAGNS